MDAESVERQFIFKESEFEVESFVPANFVAKYRKVNSLESLKEQLVQYSTLLKQQLYNIINRDYKDFITISTKLDGVDTRTSFLQKPLLEIRGDVSALHEGVVTSMQAIQEKVRHRLEVSRRRQQLDAVLRCMDRLDTTAAILASCHSTGGSQDRQAAAAQGGLGDLLQGPPAAAEGAVHAGQRQQTGSTPRSRLLRVLDKRVSASASAGTASRGVGGSVDGGATPALLLLERDVFVCSELERAAYCLASVGEALDDLQQHCTASAADQHQHQQGEGEGYEEAKDDNNSGAQAGHPVLALLRTRSGLLSLHRTLQAQAAAHRQALVSRVQSQLTHLLTNAIGAAGAASAQVGGTEAEAPEEEGVGGTTASSSSSSSSSGGGSRHRRPLTLRKRSVAHCLRALCVLGSPEVAEELLRSAVVGPYVRSQLTVGRVDGRGGRGSFSGLEDALQSVLDGLLLVPVAAAADGTAPSAASTAAARPTFLQAFLEAGETVLSYCAEGTAPADSSGPGTGDAGSSSSPSRGGRALDLVVQGLWLPVAEVLQERFGGMFSVGIPATQSLCYRAVRQFLSKLQTVCGPAYAPSVAQRLQQHPLVVAFFGQWRLDLYYQLRCKEVFGRLDKVCASALRQGPAASPLRLLDDTYGKPDGPHAVLRAGVEAQLTAGGGCVQSAAFTATALELRACLHPSVLLEPLASKFLALILRTIMRIEAHVAVAGNVCTPSFASREELEQLRSLCSGGAPTAAAGDTTTTATTPSTTASTSTPAGKRSATAAAGTPASSSKAAESAASPLLTLGLDELALLAGDALCLEGWLEGEFATAAASALVLRGLPAWKAGAAAVDLQSVDAVRGALQLHTGRLRKAREAVWGRVGSSLAAECRKALGAVRTAVVSKYRMTNKPAPEAASPYVETILAPLRSFKSQHGALLERLTAGGEGLTGWLRVLLEEVSGSFAEQVSALIDTVKQMDSTLQRRSKLQQQQQSAGAASSMTDSEKIALQIKLDIEAYGRELQDLGMDLASLPAFCTLRDLNFETS